MKRNGHALVEFVLCGELVMLLLFGSAVIHHLFRARAAALTLLSAGSRLAAHPELSNEERSRLLSGAGRRLLSCPACAIEIQSQRYLGSPAARFYDFIETRAVIRLGHRRLRRLLGIPDTLQQSAVVAREPNHDAS